jgi:hypothetical protein
MYIVHTSLRQLETAHEAIRVTWQSQRGEFIKAIAPIHVWEALFETTFHEWHDQSFPEQLGRHSRHRSFVLAEEYSIPTQIQEHVFSVYHTVQVPPPYNPTLHLRRDEYDQQQQQQQHQPQQKEEVRPMDQSPYGASRAPTYLGQDTEGDSGPADAAPFKASASGSLIGLTVPYLNNYYLISSNIGSSALSQTVFETAPEYFSPSDLLQYQQQYGLTEQEAISVGQAILSGPCPVQGTATVDCSEGNLDLQIIMGIAQKVETFFWYVGGTNPYVDFMTQIANSPKVPAVNSISWGSIEALLTKDIISGFNTEAMKLAAMGVTVLVASGDNGRYARTECDMTCLLIHVHI